MRILDAREGQSGTGAVTRVMIEFRTPDGTIWRTVGVSTNIIDASVVALGDGMMWKAAARRHLRTGHRRLTDVRKTTRHNSGSPMQLGENIGALRGR